MTLNLEQIETDLAAGRTDHRRIRKLIEEVKRLRAEVERLTSPRPGFLAWAMQVEDALPVGMAKGVKVEELRRWFEEGMDAKGAADEVAQRGQRVRETG